jgi:hypothetical protein
MRLWPQGGGGCDEDVDDAAAATAAFAFQVTHHGDGHICFLFMHYSDCSTQKMNRGPTDKMSYATGFTEVAITQK